MRRRPDLTPAERAELLAFLRRVDSGEIRSDAYVVTPTDHAGRRLALRLDYLDDGHAASPLYRLTAAGAAFVRSATSGA